MQHEGLLALALHTACVDQQAGVIDELALLHRVQRTLRHGIANFEQLPPRDDIILNG